jgi:phage-related protein
LPKTTVILFCEEDGEVPLLAWFERLPTKAQDKCRVRIERLAELGHELRRPESDYLRHGIYELRAKHGGVNYRILYFFHGSKAVVLSHGFSKQQAKVPAREIRTAVDRKKQFEADPRRHTHVE